MFDEDRRPVCQPTGYKGNKTGCIDSRRLGWLLYALTIEAEGLPLFFSVPGECNPWAA